MKIFKRYRNSEEKLFLEESGYDYKKISKNIKRLLGLKFRSKYLLLKALTHKSRLSKDSMFLKSYERLEFLGDSVLDLIVGEYLFNQFPNEEEGFLTKTRSKMVDKNALAETASRINLFEIIIYDEKFLKSSDKGLRTIAADSLEALIGAIYLDQGLNASKKFVTKWIILPNLESGKYKVDNNFKGQLLEFAHSVQLPQPIYELVSEEGPEHDKIFTVEVIIGENREGIGKGRNKKEAEQSAAQNALKKLKKTKEF